MRIDIILDGSFDSVAASDVNKLNDHLRRADVPSSLTVISVPAVKDPLTVGIALTGIAVSTIGAVIGALSLWHARQPKYSITVQRGEMNFSISNLGKDEAEAIRAKLAAAGPDVPMLIRLSPPQERKDETRAKE